MRRFFSYLLIFCLTFLFSCNKIDEFNEDPEITPLQQGFKVSAAIGYCASIAHMAFRDEPLPDNVSFQKGDNSEYSSSGVMYINVTEDNPLPFNNQIGDIAIAGLWNDVSNGGVISIIFADVDLLSPDFRFYGIHTVPIIEEHDNETITTIFAEQDVVIGEGSDTLLNLSLSKPQFDLELARADSPPPEDVFAAVKQNVWHINFDQNNTSDIYDDTYRINGGGQIAEARSESGGILYHALINTRYEYSDCALNPTNGVAFIQNLKAGTSIDLGNITMEFRDNCDGKAHVKLATGKYVGANGRDVNLHFD